MGTTCCYRERGLTDKAFFEREWGAQILDSAKGRGVFYAKVLYQGELTLAVVQTHWHGPEFCWKMASDSMGPCELDCPLRLLDGLPEPTGYAAEWREKVRAYWAKRRPRPKLGQRIRFTVPLPFTSGESHSVFTVVATGRKGKGIGYRPDGYTYVCRIANIHNRDYEVIG